MCKIKMILKQQNSMPKTANLRTCKQQWWRVCFLHGNQDKYYRQIYGRVAAQRLAGYQNYNNNNNEIIHTIKSNVECDFLNEMTEISSDSGIDAKIAL